MSMNKSSKMLGYINWRMRVTIGKDGRQLVGTFLAFDKHMNLVLADCEEFRKVKGPNNASSVEEKEEKRTLGLVLLRGENVISIQVEAPPQQEIKPMHTSGPGVAAAAGRGVSVNIAAQAPAMSFGARGPPMNMMPGMGLPPPGMMMPPPGMMMPPPGMNMPPQMGNPYMMPPGSQMPRGPPQ